MTERLTSLIRIVAFAACCGVASSAAARSRGAGGGRQDLFDLRALARSAGAARFAAPAQTP